MPGLLNIVLDFYFFMLLLLVGVLGAYVVCLKKGSSRMKNLSIVQNCVDMHVHVAGIGAGDSGCFVSEDLRNNWRYRTYLKAFGTSEEELISQGDAIVFEKISSQVERSQCVSGAVVLALDGVINQSGELDLAKTEVYIPNEFVQEESRKFKNLHFGASINPYRRDSLSLLEHVANEGAVLIKWLPAIQMIDPGDERIIPFYEKMVELDIPLLTHTGDENSFSKACAQLGDPELLRLPLSMGVKVIAAHAATTGQSQGEDNMQRLLKMMPEFPNLYADISSLTQLNKRKYLPELLSYTEFHERLIYGTDFPLINTPLVSSWFYPNRLSVSDAIRISRLKNPWDRDVQLKHSLAVPREVFSRSATLLGIAS